jgi:hypothetical protein
MAVLLGGAASLLLGLAGLVLWWKDFFTILKGGIPIVLLIGGALAVFVGFDELKDKMRDERDKGKGELAKAREELERTRAEAEKYREELEKLKGEPKI